MIGKKTLEIEPIPMAKVKDILNNYSENFETEYEQNLTLDHVKKFSKLPLNETEKLIAELENEAGLKKKYAVRLADMMAEDLSDLRLMFSKERIPIKKEEMENILDILDKYREFEEEIIEIKSNVDTEEIEDINDIGDIDEVDIEEIEDDE